MKPCRHPICQFEFLTDLCLIHTNVLLMRESNPVSPRRLVGRGAAWLSFSLFPFPFAAPSAQPDQPHTPRRFEQKQHTQQQGTAGARTNDEERSLQRRADGCCGVDRAAMRRSLFCFCFWPLPSARSRSRPASGALPDGEQTAAGHAHRKRMQRGE